MKPRVVKSWKRAERKKKKQNKTKQKFSTCVIAKRKKNKKQKFSPETKRRVKMAQQ